MKTGRTWLPQAMHVVALGMQLIPNNPVLSAATLGHKKLGLIGYDSATAQSSDSIISDNDKHYNII